MKKLIFILVLFSSFPVFAEDYAVETPDGVAIITYIPGSTDTIEDVVRANGFTSFPVRFIERKDIPNDHSDQKYWKLSGNRIVVDAAKKQADLDAKAAREARKKALLKMTDAEYAEAKSLGLVR